MAKYHKEPEGKKSTLFKRKENSLPRVFEHYQKFARPLSSREAFFARIKSVFLNMAIWFIKVSGRVPWQVNK